MVSTGNDEALSAFAGWCWFTKFSSMRTARRERLGGLKPEGASSAPLKGAA
jgi:hypothetical protein